MVGVAPGPIQDTAGMSKLSGDMDMEMVKSTVPLGRLGLKEDIAFTVVFLCLRGSYITGDTIGEHII